MVEREPEHEYFVEAEAHRLIRAIGQNVSYVDGLIRRDISTISGDPDTVFKFRYKEYFDKLYDYVERLSGMISLPQKPRPETVLVHTDCGTPLTDSLWCPKDMFYPDFQSTELRELGLPIYDEGKE